MFDALGVDLGVCGRYADDAEQLVDQAVAVAALGGEFLSLAGEEDGAVGLGFDQVVALEAGDDAIGGDVRNIHVFGEVDEACFALGG